MTNKLKLLTIIIIVVVGFFGYAIYKYIKIDPKLTQDEYRYEIRLDPDFTTGIIGILVYERNLKTGLIDSTYGIGDTDLYLYIQDRYGISDDLNERIVDSSLSPEYIEGLSSDNKYISGKLIDPQTKQQIGHWTYDLDKKKFSEFTLNLPK